MGESLKLDPVTDETGQILSDDDVISRALEPEKITFKYGGLNYMAWIRKTQISGRLHNRVQGIMGKLALRAGFKEGEKVEDDDPRNMRFLELMMENEVLDAANADIAIAATIIQDGVAMTSLPFPKEAKNFTRESLLELGGLGGAYIDAVNKALRPTLAEATPEAGAAEAPKTKKAKVTAS